MKAFYGNSNVQEAQLLCHSASVKEKHLPCYHLGGGWAPQAGRQAGEAWMWTGARNKAIRSSKSTETMKPTLARKKCLLTYKFPWSLAKQLPFLSFPAKHVMFRGEEAVSSSSSFTLQNNFIGPEFSFIKRQGFIPSSVSLPPFAFSPFVYNVIISPHRKTESSGQSQKSVFKTYCKK